MKQIILFVFPGSAAESRKIESMQGRAFKKEKYYNPSCKMEKLNGGGYRCTDFYGRLSGYPCPSQPHVMHQSQLCCTHDCLSTALRCSCVPSSCADQDPRRNGSAQHPCLLAPLSSRPADRRRNTGASGASKKYCGMAAADHFCCMVLFGLWVIPNPTDALLGSSEI